MRASHQIRYLGSRRCLSVLCLFGLHSPPTAWLEGCILYFYCYNIGITSQCWCRHPRVVCQFVNTEMKAYRLYTVVPRLVGFIEQLTNWYVRLNRNRLKGAEGTESARTGGFPFYAFSLAHTVVVYLGGAKGSV